MDTLTTRLLLALALAISLAGCSTTDGTAGGDPVPDGAGQGLTGDGSQGSSDGAQPPTDEDTGVVTKDDTEGDIVDPEGDTGEGPTDECPTEGIVCDDGDCCTTDDSCVPCDDGDCEGPFVCEGTPVGCDDGVACTLDTCACVAGEPECSSEVAPDGTACEYSENDCTEGDQCEGGQCVPGPVASLDDDNPCTQDLCIKGVIEHQPLNEGQCDDGNECTTEDSCVLGTCTGGPTITCEAPACAGSASCVPGSGCVPAWLPEGASCDDGDACTFDDACDAEHQCVGGDPITCELPVCGDTATCVAGEGCVVTWKDGGECDDDNPCTDNDTCSAEGGCAGQPAFGSGAVCSSSTDCAEGEVCHAGECLLGCEDDDPATCVDACVAGVCESTLCGDTCEVPIELGDDGVVDVDLCDFQQDYGYGWCGSSGPELFFTVNVNYSNGQIVMDTTGSFPGLLVNYRWWSVADCESENSYEVNGFCYNGPAGVGWGGYDPDNVLYFGVGSLDGTCGPVKISATTKCNTSCWNKECGDDGCGGVCGACGGADVCTTEGQCVEFCSDKCEGMACGPDSCGGSCGTCPIEAPFCLEGGCVAACTPDCGAAVCGDDGCGGSCGHCLDGEACDGGACAACVPDCDASLADWCPFEPCEAECGDDGCGGTCGSCAGEESCTLDGQCAQL